MLPGAYAAVPAALDQAPAQAPPAQAPPARQASRPRRARQASRPSRRRPAGPVLDLPATICNQTVGEPSRLPPAGGGPLLTAVMLCFEKQGGSPVVEANTYLYYMQARAAGRR